MPGYAAGHRKCSEKSGSIRGMISGRASKDADEIAKVAEPAMQKSARRIWASGLETVSGSGMRMKKGTPQLKSTAKFKIQQTSLAEAELDEEIRNLQAEEERRGNCASQTNGCCFHPAVVEHFITSSLHLFKQNSARY